MLHKTWLVSRCYWTNIATPLDLSSRRLAWAKESLNFFLPCLFSPHLGKAISEPHKLLLGKMMQEGQTELGAVLFPSKEMAKEKRIKVCCCLLPLPL